MIQSIVKADNGKGIKRNVFNKSGRKAGKDGFLYFSKKEIPLLRVPSKNASVIRDIRYISLEELAQGMKAILKQNISVGKSGLFRLLVQQLGFSRMGEAISKRLEDALSSISNDIEINGDIVSLKR